MWKWGQLLWGADKVEVLLRGLSEICLFFIYIIIFFYHNKIRPVTKLLKIKLIKQGNIGLFFNKQNNNNNNKTRTHTQTHTHTHTHTHKKKEKKKMR